jgi:lycopene cyclase domain-containing protein
MGQYTYLAIDFFSVIVPFIFSFHPKLEFHKTWKAYFPACIVVAITFISWDFLYTSLEVWNFNSKYLTGVFIFNLPIEEVLFFICIPYASIFSYHCFKILIKTDYLKLVQHQISYFLIGILLLVGLYNIPKLYTSVTFVLTAVFILLVRNKNWLSRYYFAYIILLIPFLIVNGLLTGTGIDEAIVRYNSQEFIGLRILTIPIEDTVYGFLLLGLNAWFYESLLKHGQKKH